MFSSIGAAAARRPGLAFAVLAVGGLSASLLQSLVVPALRDIQLDLHTSGTSVTWVLTAYLLSASVATPILGRLGDMFGKKRMLVLTLAVLATGALVSALAGSLSLLVAGRVIQGVGGAVFPLSFALVRDEFPRERVATGIALISAVAGVGIGLGIALAGPIMSHLSYHWLFWIPFAATTAAAVAALAVVPESKVRTPGHVDWLGAAGLAAWLVALLLAISEGRTWGWSSIRIITLFAAAAVLAVAWVAVEARSRAPLVDMKMMRLRPVLTTNAAAALIGFGMFGSFILVPQFVEMPTATGYGFGASVTQAGLYLLPLAAAMLVFSPVAGRLASTIGSRLPLLLGAAAAAVGFLLLALAHTQHYEIYLDVGLGGAGMGLAFAAMTNLIVESVPEDETGVATGMNAIMRSVGGAFGSTISAILVANSVAAGGLPREHGFTLAFAVSAAGLAAAVLASLAVPRRKERALAPSLKPSEART